MSVQSFSDKTYYSALALKCLDRGSEAEVLLRSLETHAQTVMAQQAKVDYFATSLPAMLLFNDDLQKRKSINATFLRAQACLGLGEIATGKQLIREVLQLDRNHPQAADMLAELELHLTVQQT